MQCATSQNLRPDQVDSIKQLQGKTCTMVACVPARIFFSSTREKGATRNDRWIYSNLSGVLSLTIDRREHAWVLRLFSTESLELGQLFECELYANLHESLLRLTPTFIAFQMLDGFIGIQFLCEKDGDIMMKAIMKSCERMTKEEKLDFIAKLQASQAEVLGVKKEASKKKTKKKKGGFGGWLKRVFGGGKGSKKGAQDEGPKMGETDDSKYEISLPRAFEKTSHIGWDPKKNTFIMDQVPDDVKSLLRRHKIKKKYLKDQKLAPAIFDLLTNPNAVRSSGAYLTHQGQKEDTKEQDPLFSPEIQKLKVEDKGHIVGEATPAIPAIPAIPAVSVSHPSTHPSEADTDVSESKEQGKEEGSAIPIIATSSGIPEIGGAGSALIPPPPPPPPPISAPEPVSLIEQLKKMKMQKAKAGRDKLDLKKMTEQEENTLMHNLQNMINQRRSAIEKSEFNDSGSEDEESDWSDEEFD